MIKLGKRFELYVPIFFLGIMIFSLAFIFADLFLKMSFFSEDLITHILVFVLMFLGSIAGICQTTHLKLVNRQNLESVQLAYIEILDTINVICKGCMVIMGVIYLLHLVL